MTDTNVLPNPLGSFIRQAADGAARHLLTGIAGGLVANGIIQAGDSASLVTVGANLAGGAAVWVIGYGLSLLQKRFSRKVVQEVAAAPPMAVKA